MEQNRKVNLMKKKLWMLVCVCLLAFSVTACGKTDQTSITFNGGTYDQWKDTVQQTVQQITTVSEADIDKALSSVSEKSDAVNYNFYSSWKEAVADEGDFQGFGDFTMTESNKTMVMEQILNYTNRDLSFTVVFDTTTDTPELTSMTFDKVYSLGEKMGKAGMNTLMGMGTVFVILILISIIIYAFRIIPYLQNKKKNAADATAAKEDKVVDKVIENAQMDIPEAMVQLQIEELLNNFISRLQQQGLSIDQYYQFTGSDRAAMEEQLRPQAMKTIQTRLVLEKVAEVEDIQISDEKVNEEIAKMAEAYKMTAEKLNELMGDYEKEQMKKDLAVQEAVTLLADAAKVTEVVENKEA